jgi:hypothetical protein
MMTLCRAVDRALVRWNLFRFNVRRFEIVNSLEQREIFAFKRTQVRAPANRHNFRPMERPRIKVNQT